MRLVVEQVVVRLILVADAVLRKVADFCVFLHQHRLPTLDERYQLAYKDQRRLVLIVAPGLTAGHVIQQRNKFFQQLLRAFLAQLFPFLQVEQQHGHADTQPGDNLRQSAVTTNPCSEKVIPVIFKGAVQYRDKAFLPFLISQEFPPQPLGIAQHAALEDSPGRLFLKEGQLVQIDRVLFQFNNKAAGAAALPYFRRKLCRDDCVALGRPDSHGAGVRAQPSPSHPVTVGTDDTLRSCCELLLLLSPAGMEVIDTGQHILEGERIVDNTVRRIPEGQRQIRSSEAAEEGKEQRRKGTLSRAGSSLKQEDELRFTVGGMQEVIQRRKECKSQ